ncbi:YkyB family protein [Fredinandcohnia salidurans]|uniref:YkyB family protein n=1 Tax=Fredinandcohnia salidurans TaxID=2595041 RepID=A0ABW4MV47_9BACI
MIFNVEQIAAAIHVINKHAKIECEHSNFYQIKDEILKILIKTGQAQKIGLDLYKNVRNGQRKVLTSVQIGTFTFTQHQQMRI